MSYYKKLRGFLRYNRHKILSLKVIVLLGWYRIIIAILPMRMIERHLGIQGQESVAVESVENSKYANLIRKIIIHMAAITPWSNLCFGQAMTAQQILRERGIDATLYFGVKQEKDRLLAHSWVRCGTQVITGDNGVIGEFGIVKFYRSLGVK